MTAYALAFAASFLYVALKALQQLNVVHFAFRWVYPCSFGMAACEFFIVGYMAAAGPSFAGIASVGLGAGTGATIVMLLYKRGKDETTGING